MADPQRGDLVFPMAVATGMPFGELGLHLAASGLFAAGFALFFISIGGARLLLAAADCRSASRRRFPSWCSRFSRWCAGALRRRLVGNVARRKYTTARAEAVSFIKPGLHGYALLSAPFTNFPESWWMQAVGWRVRTKKIINSNDHCRRK
jgi:hypothetical protein